MSDLVGYPEDRFSHVAAHFILSMHTLQTLMIYPYIILERMGLSKDLFCVALDTKDTTH